MKEKDNEINKLKQDLEAAKNKEPEKIYIKEIVKEEVFVNPQPKTTNQIENESEVSASEHEEEQDVKQVSQKADSPKSDHKENNDVPAEAILAKSESPKENTHKDEPPPTEKAKSLEENKTRVKSPAKVKTEKELKYVIYQLKMKMNEKNMEISQFIERVIFESNHNSETASLQTISNNLKKFMAYSRPAEVDDLAFYMTDGKESTSKSSITQIITTKLKYTKFDANSGNFS